MNTCGWFKFEYDPLAIRHVYTNQSVTVKDGRAINRDGILVCEYASPNNGDSIQFDLELDNITRAREFHVPEFRVNYNSIFTSPPDYQRWKLIDDFLTDALTCWPEFLADRKRSPPNLRIEGGWCNGRWTPRLIRLFSFWKDATFLERAQTSTPAEPTYILRKADQQWEYVDCESPHQRAALDYVCPPPSFVPYLGHDEPVTGFQGTVPYLVTTDRRAYIAPISFGESMGHDDCLHPHANYIYLNDNLFYQFEMRDQSKMWMYFIHYFGFRDFRVGESYWPLALGSNEPVPPQSPRKPNDIFTNGFVLSYRVWRESMDAITDAWSAWRNPARKVVGLRDSYVGGFDPKHSDSFFFPEFYGGYSAGLSNECFLVRYKYAQPIIPPDAAR
jgi:hypothetical protein